MTCYWHMPRTTLSSGHPNLAGATQYFVSDWYWSASGCTYAHTAGSNGACLKPTASDPEGLTGNCVSQDYNGGHMGLSGWDSALSGGDWLHTSHSNGHFYICANRCNAGGGGTGNSCNAATAGCDIEIYVR